MTLNKLPPGRDVVVAHSSDLHMDDDHTVQARGVVIVHMQVGAMRHDDVAAGR